MSLLLDTNILVDYYRGSDAAATLIEGLAGKPSVSICTIVELTAGARNRREELGIENLHKIASILPITFEIAVRAGQFVRHYHASHGLDDLDAIIAATAEHHRLKLATLNVKHFPMLRGLKRAY